MVPILDVLDPLRAILAALLVDTDSGTARETENQTEATIGTNNDDNIAGGGQQQYYRIGIVMNDMPLND